MTQESSERLGVVVSGSLNKGIEVKLDSSASVEDMAVGRYVTIEGGKRRFFGMITDVSLGVTDQRITISPPDVSDPFMAEVLAGASTYGTLHVLPRLTIGGDVASLIEGPQPVKTIPSHFSTVNLASERDMELVFGKEDNQRFWIGNPLDMETKLCLNLEEFVKRSNGKINLKQEGRIMSDWFGAILKKVERFFGLNWIELIDERARPAVRQLAQRCKKYSVWCVSWIKRKGNRQKTQDNRH